MSANNTNRIYLDNASTTRIDPRVLAEMMPYLTDDYGNASSLHYLGTSAKQSINKARKTISRCINAKAEEIVFTSSGTEANNLALKGIAFANREKGNHIIVSAIEHDCILNTCHWLETQGFFITYIPVDNTGFIDLDFLEKCINKKTILVSMMHANNEIGTINPIDKIGLLCKERNVYFHTDACQSFGKLPVDVVKENIDLLTINSHKIYGPKGAGALYIKDKTNIQALLHGGGQENNLRSSTENIPAIMGFAKAAELCFDDFDNEVIHLLNLRNKIIKRLSKDIEGIYFNGDLSQRLPNNINFCIKGLEGEGIRLLLLMDEDGVDLSAGSACSSNSGGNPSHVLQAIGLNQFEARGSVRISLGRFNTQEETDIFPDILINNIKKLKSIFS
ncbi:MAG: cysteine desulfurase family protein [Bacteroidetes bacterium]|nr:cysteine desulfurase family protein [Bacteroidota bacterium]